MLAASGAIAACLCFHFAMTFLAAAPTNPLSISARSLVNGYTEPFFGQNWRLFAPQPQDVDVYTLVRAELPDGTQYRITPFLDMTTAALDHAESLRFLPLQQQHVYLNAASLLQYQDPELSILRQQLTSELRSQLTRVPKRARVALAERFLKRLKLTPGENAVRQEASSVLRRLGSLAARKEWGQTVMAVQIRVSEVAFPGFAYRSSRASGRVTSFDLPWTTPQVPST